MTTVWVILKPVVVWRVVVCNHGGRQPFCGNESASRNCCRQTEWPNFLSQLLRFVWWLAVRISVALKSNEIAWASFGNSFRSLENRSRENRSRKNGLATPEIVIFFPVCKSLFNFWGRVCRVFCNFAPNYQTILSYEKDSLYRCGRPHHASL